MTAPPRPHPVTRRALVAALAGLTAGAAGAAAPGSRPVRLVVLGDSLSAGFLLHPSAAFPVVLEAALRGRGVSVTVANAAVTSDASWDGYARLDRDVPDGTDGVILELGANDRLRGTDPAITRSYLDGIVRRLAARRVAVLLVGIRMLELGDGQAARFNAIFAGLARQHRLLLFPDIYGPIRDGRGLKLFDGVHPSPEGVQRMVAAMLPTAERFVRGLAGRAGRA